MKENGDSENMERYETFKLFSHKNGGEISAMRTTKCPAQSEKRKA